MKRRHFFQSIAVALLVPVLLKFYDVVHLYETIELGDSIMDLRGERVCMWGSWVRGRHPDGLLQRDSRSRGFISRCTFVWQRPPASTVFMPTPIG